ncbi:MAG: homoserine kinase [Leptolyngbyaceae bacterium]|nr:homoserine kinase [Leptolyngbyaceae bacterium]
MNKVRSTTVTVPATTANIGPGFDCLGLALKRHNRISVCLGERGAYPVTIQVLGIGADQIDTTPSNLAYQAFAHFYAHINQTPPPIQMVIEVNVPLARGLGSSATAIVGGLLAANALANSPLSQTDIINLAIAIEGHPDNVVPALLGGCCLTTTTPDQQWLTCDVPWHSSIIPVLAIPNFKLSTAEARKVLPDQYSRGDAIFNTAHLGLLVRALETGRADWLTAALQDRIHQPYRQSLIHHYEAVKQGAIAAGAYGLVISGAGPTVLALTSQAKAKTVEKALAEVWQSQGIETQAMALEVDQQGATVQSMA